MTCGLRKRFRRKYHATAGNANLAEIQHYQTLLRLPLPSVSLCCAPNRDLNVTIALLSHSSKGDAPKCVFLHSNISPTVVIRPPWMHAAFHLIQRSYASARDLTERKRIEEDLKSLTL